MAGVHRARRRARGLALLILALVAGIAGFPQSLASATGCGAAGSDCPPAQAQDSTDFKPAPVERWIEVDLGAHEVVLHSGSEVVERLAAATGRNDSPWTTTYPGAFRVYSKAPGPAYLPDQDVYVRDWVGFDPEWRNGLHSLPLDWRGRVLDARVGVGITSGCIRVAASDSVYRFAEIGMLVYVRGNPVRSPRLVPARWTARPS